MERAIIIGATSGIGKELAKVLIKKGYKVGICGRRTNLLKQLKDENPEMYIDKTLDITENEKIVPALEELVSELGGLDLLVISAGIIKYNIDLDFSIENKTIETNVRGFTCIADWGFNFFKNQKHGHFVGISSVAGFRGWRNNPSYNASKSYQMNYMEGLRSIVNYLKLPITVTDIRPGYVKTSMMGKTLVFWVSSPQQVALDIYKAIRRKKQVAYVSSRWRLGAWLYRRLPDRIVEHV